MVRNSGTITPQSIDVDTQAFRGYVQGKTALVAQGGGQRGIFTAGVLDAFLSSQFDPFDEFYGTSAGALNLCAYLCRKPEVGKGFITDITTSQEFFNLIRYIRSKQYLEVEWALGEIQKEPWSLDIDKGYSELDGRAAFAAVTDQSALTDHYLPIFTKDWLKTLVATCAIPKLAKESVTINDREFLDGGISASIPVQEAWRRNNRTIFVIRTEPVEDIDQSNIMQLSPPEVNGVPSVQESLQQRWALLKEDWSQYIQQKLDTKQANLLGKHSALNGGRWLFGADNLYRLSHLIGENFDSGLADMLMIHYQTYELTLDFLQSPPDDAFILQIAPSEELKSSSLLSSQEDLEHDYLLGLEAGRRVTSFYRDIYSFTSLKSG